MRALVQRLNQEFDYDEELLLPDERALKNWGPAPGNPPVHEAELDEDTEKTVMWLQKDISVSYGNDSERVFMFHTAFISRKLYLDNNMDGRSVEFSLLIQDEETEASERENEKSYEDLKEEFGLEEEGDREFERITVVLANGEKFSNLTDLRHKIFDSFYTDFTFLTAKSDRYKESYGNSVKYVLNQMCRHDIVNIIIDDVEFPINPSLFSTSQLMREYVRLHNAKFGYGYYPHIPDERRLDQWDAASSYSSSYIPSTSSGGNFANVSQASKTEAPVKSISIPASANVKDIYVEHDVTVNGEKGINVVCSFDVSMLGTDGICAAYIYNADGTPLKDTNKRYSTSNGYVANHTVFTPQGFSSSFDNLKIFFPYSELHIDMNKYTPLKVYFGVFNSITLEKLGESPWSEFYCASGSSTNQTNITLTQADATDKQSLSATQLVMKPFGLLNINLNSYTIDNALKALNEYEGFSPHVSEKSISLSKFSGYNYRVNNLNIDNASLYISGNYISYGYDTRIKKSDITLEEMVNHAHEIVNSLRKDGAIIIEDVPTEELTLPHAARIMKASRKSSGTLFEFNGIYKGRRIELKIYIGAVSEVGDGYGISLNIIKG